ncbi:MAG: hypothetical protein K0B15_00575 [Lentimicrobium sp.]|nr:hypothetical protein [Lentimicrobium sp.]
MRIIKKVVLIFLLANIIRIIPGCCKCSEEVYNFNFNRTDIRNIDNTGNYAKPLEIDTMLPGAVAFEVSIFDSLGYFYYAYAGPEYTGFKTAAAMSCDCAMQLQTTNYLNHIKITTLYDLSSEIKAGDDVSEHFVASLSGNSSHNSGVYQSLTSVCTQTIDKIYYDSGVESFRIFLKPEVENTKARFAINLTLSDNTIFSDTTNLIQILQ